MIPSIRTSIRIVLGTKNIDRRGLTSPIKHMKWKGVNQNGGC